MTDKTRRTATVFFLAYAASICLYFLLQPVYAPPAGMEGTPADPAVFLTSEEIRAGSEFTRIRYIHAFLYPALQVYILYLLLSWQAARRLADRTFARIPVRWLRLLLSAMGVYAIWFALLLPYRFLYFQLRLHYGLSVQSPWTWIADRGIEIGVSLGTEFAAMALIWLAFARWPRRWWLAVWGASIPITLFFVLLQPVIIAPLYHTFSPIQDEAVKNPLLELAAQAGVQADAIYEADVSRRTTAVNAYVDGIGASARIVLWDTTLQKLEPDEVASLMAHELGHYVHKHVYWGTAAAIVGAFLFLAVLAWCAKLFLSRLDRGDPQLFPALMLTALLLLFAANPINSRVTLMMEKQADHYSHQLYPNPEAAVRLHQKLARYNRSDVSQPALYRLFYGTHPTIGERIAEDLRLLSELKRE